jgi:hypothetical protein
MVLVLKDGQADHHHNHGGEKQRKKITILSAPRCLNLVIVKKRKNSSPLQYGCCSCSGAQGAAACSAPQNEQAAHSHSGAAVRPMNQSVKAPKL